MSRTRYQWQGKDVSVRFGFVKVKPNTEKPLYWYNYECETSDDQDPRDGTTRIEAIEVTYQEDGGREQVFTIANHFGIGVHKLKHGGWPTHQHFSFGDHPFRELDLQHVTPHRFDEVGFAQHEAGRERWMKATDPKEFERLASLKKIIAQGRAYRPK